MAVGAGLGMDGWMTLTGVRRFEDFEIEVLAEVFDGQKRLIGLRLNPKPEARLSSLVLTSARLRALPLTNLMEQALRLREFDFDGWAKVARETAEDAKVRPRGGGSEHSQAVAAVYSKALEAPGVSARRAVKEAFGVSLPTADRYIREARKLGYLAPYRQESQ